MKVRAISFYTALVVLGASLALGEGNYQRTKDGKAIVWNGDPKPGDAASWFGGRDKERYASGTGTLIWYTGKGEIYARYHGRMVRGKFDGPVDVQSQGKTAHATFADGERTTRWARGSAPSRTGLLAQAVQAATSPSPAPPEPAAQAPTAESQPSNTAPSAPSTIVKDENAEQRPDKLPQSVSSASAERETANAQPLPPDIPGEGPLTEKSSSATPAPKSSAGATAASGRQDVGKQTPATQSPQPTITIQEQQPELTDFSGPPAALRANSSAANSPADAKAEIASASQPAATAQLTPQEAIALADSGAETRGYDLAAYERPKADYSAALGKWSLFYSARPTDGASINPPHFTVTVNDKTNEVEVRQ